MPRKRPVGLFDKDMRQLFEFEHFLSGHVIPRDRYTLYYVDLPRMPKMWGNVALSARKHYEKIAFWSRLARVASLSDA